MEQPSSDPLQEPQRLQKIIAAAGIASRRRAEEIIASGRVSIDGKIVTTPGMMANPYTQRVAVDGRQIDTTGTRRYYVALHKPTGYVSTVADRHAEKKVTDLVQIPGVRLVPAGRLDADSEGLILLSNDGDFIYRVTHPSQSLGKLYQATVKGKPTEEAIKTLSKGLSLGEGEAVTAPAHAQLIGRGQEGGSWIVELTLGEGRNRQVRRMLDTVGHPVLKLVRLRVGPVRLSGLEPGMWRELTADEVRRILTGDKSGEAQGLSAGNGGRRLVPNRAKALPPQRPGSRPPQRPSGGPPPRPSSSGPPPRPSSGGSPPRSYAPRPAGMDRPQQGTRSQGPPPPGGRPGPGGGARPYSDRPRSDRPYSDRPRGDAPSSDRPYQSRPHGGDRGDSAPPPRPGSDRPSGGRPPGDRPYNRPSGDNKPSGGGRPQPRGNDAQNGSRERARPYYTGPKSGGSGQGRPTQGGSARPQGPRPPRPNNPNPNSGRPPYKNGGGR